MRSTETAPATAEDVRVACVRPPGDLSGLQSSKLGPLPSDLARSSPNGACDTRPAGSYCGTDRLDLRYAAVQALC
jgi:hypothetical protein